MIQAWLPDPGLFLILAPIVLVASVIFTTVGFGGGVIAVPMAVLFADLLVVLPVLAIIEAMTALRLMHVNREHIARAEAVRLIPSSAVGTALGVTLLVVLPVKVLMFGMSAFVASFLLSRAFSSQAARPIRLGFAVPFGLLGGVCSGAFGAGGPPAVIFMNLRRLTHDKLRATIATTGMANLLFRILGFAVAGLYADGVALRTAIWLMPIAWCAVLAAERLRGRVPERALLIATYLILGISAVSLFLRAAMLP